jgi:DNA-binding response OmpR family regulator
MKILIVDDDRALGTEIMNILIREGHDAVYAHGAIDALCLVETNRYDFILVDYRMPEYNGTWFMDNAHLPRSTKVLLISSYSDKRIIDRMFALGASGYLIKPFDGHDLIRHLTFHARSGVNPAVPAF